jgi:predicted protein tyrosine phosphatase
MADASNTIRADEVSSAVQTTNGADSDDYDVTEVIPDQLFLGSVLSAIEEGLSKYKIDCIVNCAAGEINHKYTRAPWNDEKASVLRLKWEDDDMQNLFDGGIVDACRFIKAHLEQKHRVLVHCHQGRSRSAAAVLFYLVCTSKRHVDACLADLVKLRPVVAPNPSFLLQLRNYCTEGEPCALP